MSSSFEKALEAVSIAEGGYSNRASDSGGETYRGVARNFHPTWPGWHIVDQCRSFEGFPAVLDTVAELRPMVVQFYKEEFWDTWNGDAIASISFAVANEIFESGVNVGYGKSARWFQRACNLLNYGQNLFPDLVVDGALGGKSRAALQVLTERGEDTDVVKLLNLFQGRHYITLTERKKSQEDFIRGWVRQRVVV
jgi:lysozyme family protein